MRRVNAARLDISPRCAFLRDFPNSNSARVLNTILTTGFFRLDLHSAGNPRFARARAGGSNVGNGRAPCAVFKQRGRRSRRLEGLCRARRVPPTSCFSVALAFHTAPSCVVHVAPSTYDLRVGELEIDRLYRRDVGLDVGGVSKQSNFGNKIALDGDTMLVNAESRSGRR